MYASVRILSPSIPTGGVFSKLQRHAPSQNLRHGRRLQFGAVNRKPICSGRVHSSLSLPFSNPVTLGLLLSAFSHHHNQHIYPESVNFFKSDPSVDAYGWSGDFRALNGGGTVPRESNRLVTAVLLGWLGADPKHLKRYAEIYASRGINTLGFVVPVSEMLWFDLGRNVESRIERLVNDIVAWLMESEKDGKERRLVFHTFSNTGWLVYGAILSRLQDRPELVERIEGCIVDSGGDPELNPKVWAAGFVTAILKKRSSVVYPVGEIGAMDPMSSVPKQKEPNNLLENILLFVLEKLFSFLLCFPDIHQRLSKVITALSKNSPPCPQLYLYSTADMVIPFHSVESFMEEQRKMGRNVCSFNFQSSPHVDHFRTFPDLYSSKVSSFLDECLSMVKAGLD